MKNIILDTDSYKSSHYLQYPPGAESMFSYIESRGGKFEKTVFFGLQYYLKEYLSQKIEPWMVDEAEEFFKAHGEPFNRKGWDRIVNEFDGKLPVKIKALPEGSVVPIGTPLITIESTDAETFWVVNWLETMLIRIWFPVNVSTVSWHIKQLIRQYLKETGEPESDVMFKLHDFGSRGVSSRESAEIGGASHLVNFLGSDTCVGVYCANKFYNEPMSAFSIPAAEHSTVTSWGKENEVDAYRNMLKNFALPGKLLAVVSDSYDIYNACENLWGGILKEEIEKSGATVVIRPDSGNPVEVVLEVIKTLEKKFGSVINSSGYKLLNTVRVIQGDGVNKDSIEQILKSLKDNGYSANNVAFGMGGALLQQHDRDTQKFAMKCSSITVNGKEIDVFKDPVTDKGKKSKKGKLDVLENYQVVTYSGKESPYKNSIMNLVFENGYIIKEYTLKEVRENSDKS